MKTVVELEERLARPGIELIEMMKRLDGDIMILGIGGKMGPLLKLADWMAEYYCCTRERALQNLMPGAVRSGRIKPKKELRFYLADAAAAAKYIAEAKKQQEKRAAMLKQLSLRPGSTADQLSRATGLGKSVLDALVKAGLVKKEAEQVDRDPFKGMKVQRTEPLPPTPDQKKALDKIFQMADHPEDKHVLLLHGITCSGKGCFFCTRADENPYGFEHKSFATAKAFGKNKL